MELTTNKKALPYIFLTCVIILIFVVYGLLQTSQTPEESYNYANPNYQSPPYTFDAAGYKTNSLAQFWNQQGTQYIGKGEKSLLKNQSWHYPVFEDLNCIVTLPDELVDNEGDMPVVIPESLNLPKEVLTCLYHRYVNTIQTLCVEPKLFGDADDHGGYLCVDEGLLPKGRCVAYFFGNGVDIRYRKQLKLQYDCKVTLLTNENSAADAGMKSSSLFRSLRQWMSGQTGSTSIIHLVVLRVTENPNDIYIVNELLQNTAVVRRIMQITLKLYFDPKTASSVGYEQRLLIFLMLYRHGFRIYSYNQDLDCKPALITQSKFLSCYSIYFMRPHRKQPLILTLPSVESMRALGPTETIRLYDRYLSSLQTVCHQNIRVGNIKSGGWNVCHDRKYRPRYPCLVYSFGINIDWTFDEGLTKTYGCDVFSFDPSIGRLDYRHSEKVWYYNIGIEGRNYQRGKWKLRTLDSIMEMLNHKDRHLEILKLDVEGSEWPALKQMIKTGILSRVRQLYLEFHEKPDFMKLTVIKTIYDLGFRIYWTHKNLVSSCRLPVDGGQSSTCFEVYFLNVKFPETNKTLT